MLMPRCASALIAIFSMILLMLSISLIYCFARLPHFDCFSLRHFFHRRMPLDAAATL